MTKKYTQSDIEQALKRAGSRFSLSEVDKATMKFNLMDVINSGSARTPKHTHPLINFRRYAMPFLPLIFATLLVAGSGTVALANSAKPGDLLFPVDLWAEKVQAKLAFDDEAKVQFMGRINDERLDELAAIEDEAKVETSAEGKAAVEDHKTEALARLAAHIEKLDVLRAKFEAKAAAATDPKKKEDFTKIAEKIREIQLRFQEHLDKVKTNFDAQLQSQIEDGEIKVLPPKQWGEVRPMIRAKLEAELENEFNLDEDSQGGASGSASVKGSTNSDNGSSAEADFHSILKGEYRHDDDSKGEDENGLEYGNNSLIQSGVNEIIKPQPKL